MTDQPAHPDAQKARSLVRQALRCLDTAEEKITLVLDEERDPLGLEIGYLHLDQITARTEVTRKTIENILSRLVKDGKVVRSAQASGEYGLPLPWSAEAVQTAEA